jgi:DNA-binding transcriptional regulator YiaG
MVTPTGQSDPSDLASYFCVIDKPVTARSLLIGDISVMGFGACITTSISDRLDIDLPLFGTSPLRTQSYAVVEEHFTVPSALAAIRRMTGFTWEELANQFDVTRRAVHDWASGKQLSRKNEGAVRTLLDRVTKLDTGSPSATRSLLAASSSDQNLRPLFQPERPIARPLTRRARERIATAGGVQLGADDSAHEWAPPKLIKRVRIAIKKA